MKRSIWPIFLAVILTACASGTSTPASVSPATPALVEEIIVSDPDVVIASAVAFPVQVT